MENQTYFDLVDLVEKKSEIIKSQAKTIAKLVNENIEKECLINELMESR